MLVSRSVQTDHGSNSRPRPAKTPRGSIKNFYKYLIWFNRRKSQELVEEVTESCVCGFPLARVHTPSIYLCFFINKIYHLALYCSK